MNRSAMPKRRKREPMNVRERPQIRDERFKRFVRGHYCLIKDKAGHVCSGKIQFAHLRKGTDGGTGLKPSDCFGNPMCEAAHREQHQIGEPAFERKYQPLNLAASAKALWDAWLKRQRCYCPFLTVDKDGKRVCATCGKVAKL